ncbi:MSHA biogenesis protein MshK [Herbaspirillum sp. HC18]|nr:MSHA biogenesis protein MshK [Herbaspirillum sp. HC18]
MAEYLSILSSTLKAGIALSGVVLTLAGTALAQGLPDPTKPPGPLSGAQNADSSAGLATGPVVQSIIVSPTRRIAIVSGKTVRQGDKIGEAKVVRITETEVVLRSGHEIQTLKLFPNIEKQSPPKQGGANVESRKSQQ